MKPLSPRRRRMYVWLFVILFFVSVPLALLYAGGYRYKAGFGLVQTGGMYLFVPYNDATIFLGANEIGRSGFLNRGFYIDDLAPSVYEVRVERHGSLEWTRRLIVEPQVVTRAEVVLPPEKPKLVRLTRGGITSSTTQAVSADVYDSYSASFRRYATSTIGRGNDDVVALVERANVYVRWSDAGRKPPDNFCGTPSECVEELAVEDGNETALSVALFDGGVVYATREGGVYFSEIDVRPSPVTMVIYRKASAGARVVNGNLIIKDGSVLYEVEGF
ncbi:hypothetical protein HY414_00935 [Candidatus Kaiserbacteria bacterium]|nr:hypothetical protein [Candidatus Kaiserbacteria bacterium]